MFIHDVIKIQYVNEGYLKDYPPCLLADSEMCDAFLPISYPVSDEAWQGFMSPDTFCMFKDYYPLLDPELEDEYRALVESIAYYISIFKSDLSDNASMPDWVYAYMNESVIGPRSDERDIMDLAKLLNLKVDEFDNVMAAACYHVSEAWLQKLIDVDEHRVPTMFGEPHVIKSLRLNISNMQVE